jgi:hypothetical protein
MRLVDQDPQFLVIFGFKNVSGNRILYSEKQKKVVFVDFFYQFQLPDLVYFLQFEHLDVDPATQLKCGSEFATRIRLE